MKDDTATRTAAPGDPNPGGLTIVYDGDCPFCSAYVRMARLRDSVGPVRLVNAREDHPAVRAARSAGLDLDRGMVVQIDGQILHGDAAMVALAALSTPAGGFNRMMRVLFRSPARARLIYPVLVAGRRLTLRALGRTPIAAQRRRG
jgi:predicted DCC family thiol-disulfide oxidoreductase YuxK